MAQRHVLVTVGEGPWSLVKADLFTLDRVSLLVALKHDEAFEVELRDVALSKCKVRVCASASKTAPSDQEAAAACELEGANTLGEVAAGLVGNNLFIHVLLPASTAAGAGVSGESNARALMQRAGCATHVEDGQSGAPHRPVDRSQAVTGSCSPPRPHMLPHRTLAHRMQRLALLSSCWCRLA